MNQPGPPIGALISELAQRLRWVVWVVVVVAVVGAAVGVWQLVHDEPSAVREDFVAVYPPRFFVPGDEAVEVPQGVGRLIGPHFDLTVSDVAVANSLAAEARADLPDPERRPRELRAAEGYELVVAHLGPAQRPYFDGYFSDDPAADLSLRITLDDGWSLLEERPEVGSVIVVSVLKGQDALLEVEDNGRAQSISLRTGERHDVTEGFYTSATQQLDYEYSGDGRIIQVIGLNTRAEDTTVRLTVESAERRPWLAGAGYAAPGRAWLRLNPGPFDPLFTPGGLDVFLRLDAAAAFSLVEADGTVIVAQPMEIEPFGIFDDVIFNVPESFTTGTVAIRPGAGSYWSVQGIEWEVAPPDGSVTIQLTEQSL